MAKLGNRVDAFDISENGIEKAKKIADQTGVNINYFCCDLEKFIFEKEYDVILSHGVLHLPYKNVRDEFIAKMQNHTTIGGYNVIGIFTNRLPATPDNAPYTHSLFDVGELPKNTKIGKSFIIMRVLLQILTPVIFIMSMHLRGLLQSVFFNINSN